MQEIPSRTYNDDVMFICKIRGVEAIEKEYGKLKNYDVILTEEEMAATGGVQEQDILRLDEIELPPLHDTGSVWYKVISFIIPILGLIMGEIFKSKKHYRNYKACRKGAIAGLITFAAIFAFFALCLLLEVV